MHVDLVSAAQHDSLADLLCEVHGYYNEGAAVSRAMVGDYLRDDLLGAGSPLRLAVASEDGIEVLGFAATALTFSLVEPAPERRRQCWLKELYVRASQRGRGVGRALMTWVARHALENHCARIDWPVRADNARGIAFYQRIGAKQVIERLSYRLDEPGLSALAGVDRS